MNILKSLKKLTGNNLVLVVAAVALFVALCNYSRDKRTYLGGFEGGGSGVEGPSFRKRGVPQNILRPPQSPGVNNPNTQSEFIFDFRMHI